MTPVARGFVGVTVFWVWISSAWWLPAFFVSSVGLLLVALFSAAIFSIFADDDDC